MKTGLTIVCAAALVRPDGRVLVQLRPADRPLAKLWEFPGGKCEAGEDLMGALRRELREELAVEIVSAEPVAFATERQGEGELCLLLYLVEHWSGTPVALHADAIRWVGVAELGQLDMPPADAPLVTALQRRLA